LGDFEVFRWNLENAAKVPGDIGGQRVFKGFWLGFWPKVDQGRPKWVIRGCRWCFRDDGPGWLPFDQSQLCWPGSLGLINPAENLGHHSLPPLNRISSRDSTTRLEQPSSNKAKVTKVEDILAYTSR
jgi:hypothetical protein